MRKQTIEADRLTGMLIQKRKPLSTVLIKPAGPDCNMDCSYCFYLEKASLFGASETHRMTAEILEETVRQVMEQSGPGVSMAWQGGEPTLMGLDFYKRAVDLQKKFGAGKLVENSLQTNGIFLDSNWAAFLRENNWLVGISLDGPKDIHDRYRLDRGRKGTHLRVEENARMLFSEGVLANAMCVVTSHSVKHADDLYHYFKDLGYKYMHFIPILERDEDDPGKLASYSVSARDYGEFLIRMFDLWVADFENGMPGTSLNLFETLLYPYVRLPSPNCTLNRACGNYVVVEHNGDVYSCDFFVEPQWKLGNIGQHRILDMLNSEKQNTFGSSKGQIPQECKECKWLSKCYGGCLKDRKNNIRNKERTAFCESHKMFFEHADPMLEQMALKLSANHMQ